MTDACHRHPEVLVRGGTGPAQLVRYDRAAMSTSRDGTGHAADPNDRSAPLVIVNPRAARIADPRRRRDLTTAIEHAVLARTGRSARVVEGSLAEAHAAIAGLAAGPAPPLVVAAGGDGTIRDVASALAGRPVPLALVPGGTGNVLASALGLGSVRAALDAIRHGREHTIDLGSARWGATPSPTSGRPGPRSRRRHPARGCSWWPAGWASTHGSWPRPSTSGSGGCSSARTSARRSGS